MSDEQWRMVPGFSNYEVSNLSRFRNAETGRVLKKLINCRTGRCYQKFFKGSKQWTVISAPIIAAVWIGPRPPGMQVDHIDGNKQNESVSNLEYVTQEMNVQRSYDKGQHPNRPGSCFFLTEADYAEIKRLYADGHSQVAIGKMKKIHNSTVSKIVNGKIGPRTSSLPRKMKRSIKPLERTLRFWRQVKEARRLIANDPSIGKLRLAKLMKVDPSTAFVYLRAVRTGQSLGATDGSTHQSTGESTSRGPSGDDGEV